MKLSSVFKVSALSLLIAAVILPFQNCAPAVMHTKGSVKPPMLQGGNGDGYQGKLVGYYHHTDQNMSCADGVAFKSTVRVDTDMAYLIRDACADIQPIAVSSISTGVLSPQFLTVNDQLYLHAGQGATETTGRSLLYFCQGSDGVSLQVEAAVIRDPALSSFPIVTHYQRNLKGGGDKTIEMTDVQETSNGTDLFYKLLNPVNGMFSYALTLSGMANAGNPGNTVIANAGDVSMQTSELATPQALNLSCQ